MSAAEAVAWVFNRYFKHCSGGEKRPVFFDIDRTYPALRLVDRAFPAIRAEAAALLQLGSIPAYHELDGLQRRISDTVRPERKWRVFMLEAAGVPVPENQARCPHTMRALRQVPGLFQAFFSLLEPGKSVPAHAGPFQGYLRYHLGCVVPRSDPPLFLVAGQAYTWREGESVLFDDSWMHEVKNNASEPRIVLVVDVLRPLPPLATLLNRALVSLIRTTYAKPMVRRATRAAALR